jgi:hypothetical protein
VAIVFGALLFITRATEYTNSNLFVAKMVAVGLGTLNALLLRRLTPLTETPTADTKLRPRLRVAASISLGLWLAALTLGRLIGYF